MRSFATILALFFALFAFAAAQESDAYDATVYVTSTVYRVNTVTSSGTPSSSVANTTSTISASHAAPTWASGYPVASSSLLSNGTSPTTASPSSPQFTGAASALALNAYAATLVAAAAYLVL